MGGALAGTGGACICEANSISEVVFHDREEVK